MPGSPERKVSPFSDDSGGSPGRAKKSSLCPCFGGGSASSQQQPPDEDFDSYAPFRSDSLPTTFVKRVAELQQAATTPVVKH